MAELPTPTRRELEILAILWELEEASVRDVYERMRESERIAYNTVQTFLRAMEDKGLVVHRVDGRAFVYRAAYSREKSVSSFVNAVFQGATGDLVVSLLRTQKLSGPEIDEIEDMLKSMREKKTRKKRKKN